VNFLKSFLIIFFFIIHSPSPLSSQTKQNDHYAFIKEKLKSYHLYVESHPATYQYKTEIISGTLSESFALDEQIEAFAQHKNAQLNNSILFDSSFITNSHKARKYHLKNKFVKKNIGTVITFETCDGKTVTCTYFDRNCNQLIIVGGGFTNAREVMSPFVDMFYNYDILIFDYRGHGYEEKTFLEKLISPPNLIDIIFDVNHKETRIGQIEENDVFSIVTGAKTLKSYNQIAGVGICYSALIFTKAESIWQQKHSGEKLFDKLILDGCWLTMENFAEKLAIDPKRIFSPQKGGWEHLWPFKTKTFQKSILSIAQELFDLRFNKLSILDYLPQLKNVPILYFYGKHDLVINRQEFEIIWNAINIKEKTGIITSNPHVINHLKQKELYQLICDLFLQLPHNQFISCLHNKETLLQYYTEELRSF
jgi:pimeloyl-ACP methyl ester carboxylesterase